MHKFYLFGQNISKSFSPQIHRACFKFLNIDKSNSYQIEESPSLSHYTQLLKTPDFGGASVTIPYKESFPNIIKVGIAQTLGNINTIVPNKNPQARAGTFFGYNTDYFGIADNLNSHKNIQNALVIGAGATAQTVLQYLIDRKINNIVVANRSPERLVLLSNKYPISRVCSLEDLQKKSTFYNYDLIVSTVPGTVEVQLHESYLANKPVVMDVIYSSLFTPILQQALQSKCRVVPGISMLISQGLQQNQIFTGQKTNRSYLKYYLVHRYHEKYNIPMSKFWISQGITH